MNFKKGIHSRLQGSHNRGFTLIELVVAILIFSVGIMGIAKMQSMAIKGNALSMQLTEATTVTQNTIERLMNLPQNSNSLGGSAPLSGTVTLSSPAVISGHTSYSPSWTVSEVGTTGVRQVDLQVTWIEKALTHSVSIAFVKGP